MNLNALELGVDEWENIPDSVRAAFVAILKTQAHQSSRIDTLEAALSTKKAETDEQVELLFLDAAHKKKGVAAVRKRKLAKVEKSVKAKASKEALQKLKDFTLGSFQKLQKRMDHHHAVQGKMLELTQELDARIEELGSCLGAVSESQQDRFSHLDFLTQSLSEVSSQMCTLAKKFPATEKQLLSASSQADSLSESVQNIELELGEIKASVQRQMRQSFGFLERLSASESKRHSPKPPVELLERLSTVEAQIQRQEQGIEEVSSHVGGRLCELARQSKSSEDYLAAEIKVLSEKCSLDTSALRSLQKEAKAELKTLTASLRTELESLQLSASTRVASPVRVMPDESCKGIRKRVDKLSKMLQALAEEKSKLATDLELLKGTVHSLQFGQSGDDDRPLMQSALSVSDWPLKNKTKEF